MTRHQLKKSRTHGGAKRAAVFGTLAMAGFAAVAVAATPASARPKCHNGFQNVDGSNIATPYCQDLLLAQVSRQYGVKYSFNAIRNNPNLKHQVCRLVGHDIRVQHNCSATTPRFRSRH